MTWWRPERRRRNFYESSVFVATIILNITLIKSATQSHEKLMMKSIINNYNSNS